MVRLYRGTLAQPFGTCMFTGVWRKHPKWMNRTILVENNDVEGAFHLLNRLMEKEGLLKIIRNTQYYIKPYLQRQKHSIEVTSAILNEDRQRKIKFLARKNRANAYPGQMSE